MITSFKKNAGAVAAPKGEGSDVSKKATRGSTIRLPKREDQIYDRAKVSCLRGFSGNNGMYARDGLAPVLVGG